MITERNDHGSFREALRAPRPLAQLRETVQSLIDRGRTRDELLASLEQFRDTLRATDRDADGDVVLEAMDFLVGWCSPQMKV